MRPSNFARELKVLDVIPIFLFSLWSILGLKSHSFMNVWGKVYIGKVENILKGSLDSIPQTSTSLKIQFMGGKVYLR